MSLWTTLRDAFGLGGPIASSEERAAPPGMVGSAIVGDLPLFNQYCRIGGNLGPKQVSAILLEADSGRPARLVDLMNESRQKDLHLHKVLADRELSLKGAEWDCVAPEGSTERDKTIAQDCKRWLLESENFPELLGHLNGGGVLYGHSTAETLFAKDGGFIVPERFNLMSARRFAFTHGTGRLVWSDNGATGVDVMAEYPGKFLQYRPRVNGDVPAREGLARALIWAALFRNWDIRDWLQLGEIGWKPTRLGTYRKGASDRDIAALRAIVQGIASSGSGVHSEEVTVNTEWPKNPPGGRGSGTHKELFDAMGAEMSKGVLGQTLTTEAGDRGARSLGEVHRLVRKDIHVSDATGVSRVLHRHLLTPLVRFNYGPNAAVPEFLFKTADKLDLKAYAEATQIFVDAGLQIPAAHVREQAGYPEPKDGEAVLGVKDDNDNQDDPNDDNETEEESED